MEWSRERVLIVDIYDRGSIDRQWDITSRGSSGSSMR